MDPPELPVSMDVSQFPVLDETFSSSKRSTFGFGNADFQLLGTSELCFVLGLGAIHAILRRSMQERVFQVKQTMTQADSILCKWLQ